MSLNFDLSAIPEETRTIVADYDSPTEGVHKGDRIMNPVTNTLIWTTMAIGIGILNDDTIPEFAARVELYQKVHGPLMQRVTDDGIEPRPITREDVEAHKGLSTNVFPLEARTKWVKRVITDDVFRGVTAPKTR